MVSGPRPETVTTTAQAYVSHNLERTVITVSNVSSSTVYWGRDLQLATTNGMPISPGATAIFAPLFGDDPTLELYLIVGAGTAEIRVDEGFGENALLQLIKKLLKKEE